MKIESHFIDDLFSRLNKKHEKDVIIRSVMTDSRIQTENALFVPIKGENFDGHDFLLQAVENGAIASLWQRTISVPTELPADFIIYLVDDTTEALQQLANKYRLHVKPKVIAVTGSNGKTTTKDMLTSVFKTTYMTHATKGNFNNEIGLPLTILSMPTNTEILVVEMGMDAFGEISLLSQIAQPDVAIITNIGESHIEFLGSKEGIAEAKLEILEGLNEQGTIIIDGDEPLINDRLKGLKKITCGFDENNEYHVSNVTMEDFTTHFTINGNKKFTVPLLGHHHAKNASFALAVAEQFDINEQLANKALQSLEHSEMRFQTTLGKNGVTIINDAYNASATSMKAAINVVKNLASFKCKILILGDILELGHYAKQLHLSVAEEISPPINIVFTVGEEASIISEYVKANQPMIKTVHFQEKNLIIDKLEKYFNKDTIILFKASRGLALEQIVNQCLE